MAKSKPVKPPDRGRIVKAFETAWRERKHAWPVGLPSPYQISYLNWVQAVVWEIHGLLSSLSIKQLGEFIQAATGRQSKHITFPELSNEAHHLLDHALTIDPADSHEPPRVRDPKLVLKLWAFNITEEDFMKKSVTKKTEAVADNVVSIKSAKGKAKIKVFEPDAQLIGMSIVASCQLFQMGDALRSEYPKVPEVVEMANRLQALSDAFGAWAGIED